MAHSYGCWFGAGCCLEYLVELRTEVLSCLSVSFPTELPQSLVAKFQEWKWVPRSGSCQLLKGKCSVPSILYIKHRYQNEGEDTETPLPFKWEDCKEFWAHVLQSLQIENVKRERRSEVLEDMAELGLLPMGKKFLSSYLRNNCI